MKRLFFLLACSLSVAIISCSSNTTKNKPANIIQANFPAAAKSIDTSKQETTTADSGFTYKGKPISPGALFVFFDGQGKSYYINEVNLDTCRLLSNPVDTQTTIRENKNVLNYITGLNPYEPNGSITYYIVGKTEKGDFVIDAGCDYGGNYIFSRTMIISVNNNIIRQLGHFKSNHNYKFLIKKNEIINGPIHYKIPY